MTKKPRNIEARTEWKGVLYAVKISDDFICKMNMIGRVEILNACRLFGFSGPGVPNPVCDKFGPKNDCVKAC
jgi:hypothetical protein